MHTLPPPLCLTCHIVMLAPFGLPPHINRLTPLSPLMFKKAFDKVAFDQTFFATGHDPLFLPGPHPAISLPDNLQPYRRPDHSAVDPLPVPLHPPPQLSATGTCPHGLCCLALPPIPDALLVFPLSPPGQFAGLQHTSSLDRSFSVG